MSSLAEFLLARIAEDKEGATPGEGWNVVGWDHDVAVQFWDYGEVHVGHKRFLAECEAKRQIVESCASILADESGYYAELDVPEAAGIASTHLRLLALPYAEHPDYDASWRP